MKYDFNGKQINIPDKEIEVAMKKLELTKEEAIEMWLEDNEYLDNEEQIELTQKAIESGVMRTIHQAKDLEKEQKKVKKPKTVKVSDEKQSLFKEIVHNLEENDYKFLVEKENKLIIVEINDKIFKIDLIEQRKGKK